MTRTTPKKLCSPRSPVAVYLSAVAEGGKRRNAWQRSMNAFSAPRRGRGGGDEEEYEESAPLTRIEKARREAEEKSQKKFERKKSFMEEAAAFDEADNLRQTTIADYTSPSVCQHKRSEQFASYSCSGCKGTENAPGEITKYRRSLLPPPLASPRLSLLEFPRILEVPRNRRRRRGVYLRLPQVLKERRLLVRHRKMISTASRFPPSPNCMFSSPIDSFPFINLLVLHSSTGLRTTSFHFSSCYLPADIAGFGLSCDSADA